jgi:hypothetical protein
MLAADVDKTFQPLFLRHDLMIELGRLEKAIEEIRDTAPANDARQTASLEERYARISAVLDRLAT